MSGGRENGYFSIDTSRVHIPVAANSYKFNFKVTYVQVSIPLVNREGKYRKVTCMSQKVYNVVKHVKLPTLP